MTPRHHFPTSTKIGRSRVKRRTNSSPTGIRDSHAVAIADYLRTTFHGPKIPWRFVSREGLNLPTINPWVTTAAVTASYDKFICTKQYITLDRKTVVAHVVDGVTNSDGADEFYSKSLIKAKFIFSVTGFVELLIQAANKVYFSEVMTTVSSLCTDFLPARHLTTMFKLADGSSAPGSIDGFEDMVLWMLEATLAGELLFKRAFMHHVNFRKNVVDMAAVARMFTVIPLNVLADVKSKIDLLSVLVTYIRDIVGCNWLKDYMDEFVLDELVPFLVHTVAGQLTARAIDKRLYAAVLTNALLRMPFVPQIPLLLDLQPITDSFFATTHNVITTLLGFVPSSTYNMDRPDDYLVLMEELLTGLLCLMHADYMFRKSDFARLRGDMVFIPNTYCGPWISSIQALVDIVLDAFCSHGIQEQDGVTGMDIIHHLPPTVPLHTQAWRVQAVVDSMWCPNPDKICFNWWPVFVTACRQALIDKKCDFAGFSLPITATGKSRRRRRLRSQIAIPDIRNMIIGVATLWFGSCPMGLHLYVVSHVLSPYFVMTSDGHTTLLSKKPIKCTIR